MSSSSILSRIREPGDLKTLTYTELSTLSSEIRSLIVATVSKNGGHLASNLGVVELSIALHRVFNSPIDKIVWDVGHQCYAHKLLTGRAPSFEGLRRSGGISGFPKREESVHDAFDTGHSATSISAALGLLAGERILGGKGTAVAVIGDGALTGGLAYEGLSHAGQLGLPLIVILNDNKMSIGPNVGALSKYLSRLTMKARYQTFRRRVDFIVKRIPFFGDLFYDIIVRMKRGIKAVFYPENFFVDLGFEYVGPIDGHQLPVLEQVLTDVRRLGKPVVVHVLTRKGKGYEFAEEDPSSFHGVSSFSVTDGLFEKKGAPTFTDAFGKAMVELGQKDSRVVAITAAMEKGTGLSAFHKAFPDRFFDVGIAEQHAVTFAAGLAARGLRPVVAIYSTFSQRAMDQIIHDVAIQKLPVIFAVDRAGFVGDDGETHQGLFDLPFLKSVPNLGVLSPASATELEQMLRWALSQDGPCAIRYPKAACPSTALTQALELGRGALLRNTGAPTLLAFTGSLYDQVIAASDLLQIQGVDVDLYNIRFIKPIDEKYLASLLSRYERVFLVEEAVQSGGFGEYLAYLIDRFKLLTQLNILAAPDHFPSHASREELLAHAKLDAAGIMDIICTQLPVRENVRLLKTSVL